MYRPFAARGAGPDQDHRDLHRTGTGERIRCHVWLFLLVHAESLYEQNGTREGIRKIINKKYQ